MLLASMPAVPPLPSSGWPKPEVAEPFARELLRATPPGELAKMLASDPTILPPLLRNLGTVVMTSDPALRDALNIYMDALAQAIAPKVDVQQLTAIVVVDPLRYGEMSDFRARINATLPRRLSHVSTAKARAVIEELTKSAGLEFDVAEAALHAPSIGRRIAFAPLRVPDDASPIEASIYSLNSAFFTDAEIRTFLDAVRTASPKRTILVLGDRPSSALRTIAPRPAQRGEGGRRPGEGPPVNALDSLGRSFTPWPRDPFLVARDGKGVVFVNRPEAQTDREEDQNMARAIIDSLPASIDARWTTSPFFFHNGNILITPGTVWTTRYADFDVKEMARFYGRPVRFVHPTSVKPLPGVDLDSIVTLLGHTALVGDIDLGIRMTKNADWSRVQREYPLRAGDYAAAQSAMRTRSLQKFLDAVAAELQRDGFTVRRLPLLNIPTSFVARADVAQDKDFLITWNNVVLEGNRAEGFASLLPAVDAEVKKAFADAGFTLTLLPPLTHSIVLGGGYRCASNHIRR
jgi:hypothetical protein